MTTIFIDTSVLLSAAQSTIGASAIIVAHCKKRVIKGVISQYVIAAAVKNKVNILVTLDPTDFKKPAVRESVRPVEIMTPREVVTSVLPKMR